MTRYTDRLAHRPDVGWHAGASVKFRLAGEWADGIIVAVDRSHTLGGNDEVEIAAGDKTYHYSATGLIVQMTCHQPLECGCTIGAAGEITSLGEECPHRA
jgi:hypothetical protein